MDPLQFLSALAAIVIIDLVLAGDNAIVIALATRKLPAHLRTRAVIWGTVGAVVVRSLMTVGVMWLLQIPGLMLMGGLMLVWIAYKLLAGDENDEGNLNPADSFGAAIKTIVIADVVMGLDNVLGVAGAAHGNFLLVVIGLLISIPIVVWGSQIILKLVDRFQFIIYIGAAVLAWTAAKMIVSEPLAASLLADAGWISWAIYALVFTLVLGGGWLASRGRTNAHAPVTVEVPAVESDERLATAGVPVAALHDVPGAVSVALAESAPRPVATEREGYPMNASAAITDITDITAITAITAAAAPDVTRILVPVDGSATALQAVRHAVKLALHQGGVEVHLLHVRMPLPRHIARFLKHGERSSWNRAEADVALADARALLDQHGVAHCEHVLRGDVARNVERLARRLGAGQVLIGSERLPLVARLFRRSLTTQLMEISSVPVQVVAGERASFFARWALPAGAGAVLAALVVEALD